MTRRPLTHDRARAHLWRQHRNAITGRRGRTVWWSGDGYWLAHESIVGPAPAKLPVRQSLTGARIVEVLDQYTGEASCPRLGLGIERVGDLVVVGEGWPQLNRTVREGVWPSSTVRAAFNRELFEALRSCVVLAPLPVAQFVMRVDPWRGSVSWWHPRGYPVAVLLRRTVAPRADTHKVWPDSVAPDSTDSPLRT